MSGERLRVLLLAELCNPEWASLPVVAYKAARQIAELADVTLVTHVRNQDAFERVGCGPAEVEFIDNEVIARPLHGLLDRIRVEEGGWTLFQAFSYPSYLAFEWMAHRRFGERLEAGEFDVIHRLTPMSPTLPSVLAAKRPARVPFVLGPLNGGLPWPREFAAEMHEEQELLTKLRSAHRLLPFHRATFRRADAVLASFRHTVEQVPASARSRTIDFPEVGIDPALFSATGTRDRRASKTVLFCGRLVPLKLPFVLLDAFAASEPLRRHRLLFVGDGPLEGELRSRAAELGLDGCVEFTGRVPQDEVGRLMRESEIFAFPSIRELGGGVVVEAMACGMTCVVADYGGPGQLIDDDRGRKVPMGTREEMTAAFTRELTALVDNDEELERLGKAAREHAHELYSFEAKARKTVEVYEWVLGRRGRPDFWEPARA